MFIFSRIFFKFQRQISKICKFINCVLFNAPKYKNISKHKLKKRFI